MFHRLQRALVAHTPSLLRLPLRLVPFTLQQRVMGLALARVFKEALQDGDFAFLDGKWLEIRIEDLEASWFISYQTDRLVLAEHAPQVDVIFAAALNDLVLIAGRKADPDSLFFQRRLRIEGDTELGLEVKNLIDSIDMTQLPELMQRAIRDLAGFVDQGLQPDVAVAKPA